MWMTALTMSSADDAGGWQKSRAGWSEPPIADAPGAPEVFAPGGDAGRYTAGQIIGQGGMGQVRVAEDRVLRREVALKELSPARADDLPSAQRMAREAWITAWLDHPAIVAVHDAGHLPDGRPFYTMRLVRGRTLARALDDAKDAEARLSLLRQMHLACDAVASAHAAGIVHRDLKPTNILIGGHGETQVIDWGLATPTAEAVARWPELGRFAEASTGSFVGTAGYASPEQAAGQPADPRDDVFSLGAILRELVGPPERSPELSAIAARALSPRRADRYPDAGALSAELLRWFEGRRVDAYRYSTTDLLLRLLRAWRLPLTIGAVGLLALAIAIATGYRRTQEQRNRAIAAEEAEQAARERAEEALSHALVQQAIAATLEDARPRAERLAAAALRAKDTPQARGVLAAFAFAPRPARQHTRPLPLGPCEWTAMSGDGQALLCGEAERTILRELASNAEIVLPSAQNGRVVPGEVWLVSPIWTLSRFHRATGAAIDTLALPDGPWLPVAGFRQLIVDGVPWRAPARRPPCAKGIRVAALSDDHQRLFSLCGDGRILVGTPDDPAARVFRTSIFGEADAVSAAWTQDGRAIVLGMLRGELRALDAETGAEIARVQSALGTVGALATSASGLVAASGSAGGVGLWDMPNGRWLGELPAARPRSMAFEGDALWLYDGALSRWSLPRSARPYRVVAPAGLSDLALRGDGERLALAGGDGRLSVIEVSSGRLLSERLVGDRVAKSLAWSADGQAVAVSLMSLPPLVTVTPDGTMTPLPGGRSMRRLAWLPDGVLLGIEIVQGIGVWPTGGAPPARMAEATPFLDLERHGAGAIAVAVDGGLWRVSGAEAARVGERPGAIAAAAVDDVVAIIGESTLWLPGLAPIELPGAGLRDVALSPDGRRVAVGGLDGRLRVFNRRTGALLLEGAGHDERVAAVEFSPDGDWLVTASWDHSARFWDLRVLDASAESLIQTVLDAWGSE